METSNEFFYFFNIFVITLSIFSFFYNPIWKRSQHKLLNLKNSSYDTIFDMQLSESVEIKSRVKSHSTLQNYFLKNMWFIAFSRDMNYLALMCRYLSVALVHKNPKPELDHVNTNKCPLWHLCWHICRHIMYLELVLRRFPA